MNKAHERLAVYIFGVVFVTAILVIAITIPKPSQFQYTVFRIVLALACAGVAAFIPGFIQVEVSTYVRAGGAIAVFVVVYFFSPAQLVVERPPIGQVVLGPGQFPSEAIIEEQPTEHELKADAPLVPSEVTFSYKNSTGQDLKLFLFDFWKKRNLSPSPFARQIFWEALPFPPSENFISYPKFDKTNGLFGFAVGRFRPDGESTEVFFLKTKNLFYSRHPTMTVTATTDEKHPFEAAFSDRSNGQ